MPYPWVCHGKRIEEFHYSAVGSVASKPIELLIQTGNKSGSLLPVC
jgi:hypothetical protein